MPSGIQPATGRGAGSLAAQGELTRLGRAGSLRLLAGGPAGRLIFTVNALPIVRPVNFALAGELIVLPTAAGTTVARKAHDMIVAFGQNDLDAATSSRWPVTVTGRAVLVTDPKVIARHQAVPLGPWAPGVRGQFVTITTAPVEARCMATRLATVGAGNLRRQAARVVYRPCRYEPRPGGRLSIKIRPILDDLTARPPLMSP